MSIENMFNMYNISREEQEIFWGIIYPIFEHAEFQKRLDEKNYPHHDKESLGRHILKDAIVTFVLAKKLKSRGKEIDVELATIIAMFHDLYELSWQNGEKKEMFFNSHGFVHPIEGTINAITWFPNYFAEKKRSEIIIDGIIHHMYPFPVRTIDGTELEINNQKKYDYLPTGYQNQIIESTNRCRIRQISFSPSKSIEGRIMSKADKLVSIGMELNFNTLRACITGKNPSL